MTGSHINKMAFKDGLKLFVWLDKRLKHPASGNKYHKLKHNLQRIKQRGHRQVLSFGGAYSNHLYALAQCCAAMSLECIAVVRAYPGNEQRYLSNPTLTALQAAGATVVLTPPEHYRQRHSPEHLSQWQMQYPGAAVIPEGGSNDLARQGVSEWLTEINQTWREQYSGADSACEFSDLNKHIAPNLLLPVGTGATFAGMYASRESKSSIHGADALEQKIIGSYSVKDPALLPRISNWTGESQHVLAMRLIELSPRYGKVSAGYLRWLYECYLESGVLLDPVYTGRSAQHYAQHPDHQVYSQAGDWVLLHTGGLQGWFGYEAQALNALGSEAWQIIVDEIHRQ